MPQLTKGGKWVFGWCVVSPDGEIQIPPEAYAEYGFQVGESVLFLRGSRHSGGFSMGRLERLSRAKISLEPRAVGRGVVSAGERVALPPGIGVQPGDRLLVGRGSGLALGFIQRGRIYEEALEHPEIEIFVP